MKTLYIHAGYHKTGTTTIQKWCAESRELLLSEGLDYVDYRCVADNHASLALCFDPALVEDCRKSGLFNGLKEDNRYSYTRRDNAQQGLRKAIGLYTGLKNYIGNSQCDSFLISSECFCESINFAWFTQCLKLLDVNIVLVLYLRPQISWIRSVYSYVVEDRDLRYSGSLSQLPQLSMLNYNKEIKKFENVCAAINGKMVIRSYADDQVTKYGVVYDLLNRVIGLNVSVNKEYKVNISLASSDVIFLALLNKIERITGKRFIYFEKMILNRKGKSIRHKNLNIHLNKKIIREVSSSNQEIFSRYPNIKKF